MWHSSRNSYEQPRACFRRAWRSLLELPLTRSPSHLHQRSLSDCASKALAEGLLKGELRTYDAVSKRSKVPPSTLHRAHGRRSKEEKARNQQYFTPLEEKTLGGKESLPTSRSIKGCSRPPSWPSLPECLHRVKKLPSANMLLSSRTIVHISVQTIHSPYTLSNSTYRSQPICVVAHLISNSSFVVFSVTRNGQDSTMECFSLIFTPYFFVSLCIQTSFKKVPNAFSKSPNIV